MQSIPRQSLYAFGACSCRLVVSMFFWGRSVDTCYSYVFYAVFERKTNSVAQCALRLKKDGLLA